MSVSRKHTVSRIPFRGLLATSLIMALAAMSAAQQAHPQLGNSPKDPVGQVGEQAEVDKPPCPPDAYFLRNPHPVPITVITQVCSGAGATVEQMPPNVTWIWDPVFCQPRPGVECKGNPPCAITICTDGCYTLYNCFAEVEVPLAGLGEVPVGFVLTEQDIEVVSDLYAHDPRLAGGGPGGETLYAIATAERDEEDGWRVIHNYVVGKPRIGMDDQGLPVVENAVVSFEVAE